MKHAVLTLALSILLVMVHQTVRAAEPSHTLDLPATRIMSKGPTCLPVKYLRSLGGEGRSSAGMCRRSNPKRSRSRSSMRANSRSIRRINSPATALIVFGRYRLRSREPGSSDNRYISHSANLPVLVMLVPPSNRKYDHPLRFRKLVLEGTTPGNLMLVTAPKEPETPDATPGFGQKLTSLHPALAVRDLRDESLTLRISGMALRGPRELLFTTWDGDLFSLDLTVVPAQGPPSFRRIAQGLAEPMGLTISNGRVFVTEKNEATELIDEDGDGTFETYRCVSHDWPCTMDYHEYLFGAVVKDSHLYFSSSVGMTSRDKDNRQAPLRGSVLKVHIDSGTTEVVAGGLRTPDGIGLGPRGSLLVTDNQGEWLPASKLIAVQSDAFYQFRSRAPWHPLDRSQPTLPAVWLPQGEIANSPTEPIVLPTNWGPYAGQVIFGDATFGGLQRACLEAVDGVTQGPCFPFSQGFQHLFHRFEFTADGELYAAASLGGRIKSSFIASAVSRKSATQAKRCSSPWLPGCDRTASRSSSRCHLPRRAFGTRPGTT